MPLKTKSGPVIYTNLLGFLPMLALANVGNEYGALKLQWYAHSGYHILPESIPYLVLGCIVGTAIGYTGWWCREMIAATSFTIVGGTIRRVEFGFDFYLAAIAHRLWHYFSYPIFLHRTVMNKCLTILLNVMIWDKHATPMGIFWLFVSIGGGMIYQQAPLKEEKPALVTVAK